MNYEILYSIFGDHEITHKMQNLYIGHNELKSFFVYNGTIYTIVKARTMFYNAYILSDYLYILGEYQSDALVPLLVKHIDKNNSDAVLTLPSCKNQLTFVLHIPLDHTNGYRISTLSCNTGNVRCYGITYNGSIIISGSACTDGTLSSDTQTFNIEPGIYGLCASLNLTSSEWDWVRTVTQCQVIPDIVVYSGSIYGCALITNQQDETDYNIQYNIISLNDNTLFNIIENNMAQHYLTTCNGYLYYVITSIVPPITRIYKSTGIQDCVVLDTLPYYTIDAHPIEAERSVALLCESDDIYYKITLMSNDTTNIVTLENKSDYFSLPSKDVTGGRSIRVRITLGASK